MAEVIGPVLEPNLGWAEEPVECVSGRSEFHPSDRFPREPDIVPSDKHFEHRCKPVVSVSQAIELATIQEAGDIGSGRVRPVDPLNRGLGLVFPQTLHREPATFGVPGDRFGQNDWSPNSYRAAAFGPEQPSEGPGRRGPGGIVGIDEGEMRASLIQSPGESEEFDQQQASGGVGGPSRDGDLLERDRLRELARGEGIVRGHRNIVYADKIRWTGHTRYHRIFAFPAGELSLLNVNSVPIEDTFAEAFPMTAARVLVTAETSGWARTAGQTATGYAASVIGCDAEAGIERELFPDETPDGRPGISLLFFGFSRDALQKAVVNRVAQCILTCPTTACFNGMDGDPTRTIKVGGMLRYFGDGWQISKLLAGKRYWRMPTMDGEFLCEDVFGTTKGVGGGNFLILGQSQSQALAAAEAAVAAIRALPGVILPFPGGIVRSGSKVGSKYKGLRASTNEAYCPTLRGAVDSALPDGVNAVYEIVIDGLDLASVEAATRLGIEAASRPGVIGITAGNYGGKLGPHHIHLHKLFGAST